MRLHASVAIACLVILILVGSGPPNSHAVTHNSVGRYNSVGVVNGLYWFQVGVSGESDFGYGDQFGIPITGASVDIRILSPQPTLHYDSELSYWVGINLPNDAFIQVGYEVDPQVNAARTSWFWEYFLPGTAAEATGGFLGKTGDVIGPNGTWVTFSLTSSGTVWSAFVNQEEVGSIDLKVSNSGTNGPYAIAEVAKVREAGNVLGPVEFRNLQYRDTSSEWHTANTGVSNCCYGVTSDTFEGSYPYGVEGIPGENNHWLAGSGLPTRADGEYIWPWYHVSVLSPYGAVAGSGFYVLGSSVRLAVANVNLSSNTRMSLAGCYVNGVLSKDLYFTVTSDLNLTASYEEQFLVTVTSEYGRTVGSGWYDKGSEVTISVSPAFSTEGMLGAIGFDSIMIGWIGSYSGFSPGNRLSFAVNSPVMLDAVWFDSSLAIPIGVVCCVIIIIGLKRRVRANTSMFCLHCGRRVPRDSVFCPECGKEL
ncbi:MAG: zinc ribbon domain-containing protein [Candidatus Bathyarchaeia archaeon]